MCIIRTFNFFYIACSLNSFNNGGFESRNANGWTLGGGSRKGVPSSQIVSKNYQPGGASYSAAIATTHSAIVTSGYDPLIGSLMAKTVRTGTYAMRVEDLAVTYFVSVISQQINNYLCTDIYFAWLAVLENGGHPAEDSSIMLITLKDVTVGDILLTRLYNAGNTGSGVDARFKQTGAYYYTPSWQIEHLPINASRIGHNFALDVLAADCNQGAHKGYVYIDSFGGLAP
jgi:hypothetical protein